MRALLWLSFLVAVGCHRDSSPAGPAAPPTADQDALWKLAPGSLQLGLVISARGLTMLEHTAADLRAFMQKAPELAPLLGPIDAALKGHALALAAYGLAPGKGAALFMVDEDKGVFILPVVDRDKFLAAVHGTKGDKQDQLDHETVCATTHGVYACAHDAAMFDRLGTGNAGAAAAGARGDVELVVDHFAGAPVAVAVTAQLHRGGITVHGSVAGLPAAKLAMFGNADKPRLDGDRTTGFAIAHVKPLFQFVARAANDDEQRAFAASLGDPLTATMQGSSFDAQIPLLDTAIMKAFLDKCADGPLAKLGATLVNGVCHVPIPNLPGLAIDGWIDGNTLHVAQPAAHPGPSVPLTPLGKELADQSWQVAVWGHGSFFGPGSTVGQAMQQQAVLEQVPYLKAMIRAPLMLEELGVGARIDNGVLTFAFGARTAFDNPDEVVAKLAALDPATAFSTGGAATVKAIADAAPTSPFAAELHAGQGGLLVETAAVGALAALAIPAYLDYIDRAKQTEASLELNQIARSAKRYYAENAAFPTGDAAFLPVPASGATCCGGPGGNKCAPAPAAFAADKVWSALEFSIDEPSQYRYRYHSTDGKSAVVEAIGDTDCDGAPATWTLTLSIAPGGNPVTELTPPPHGIY